MEKIEFESIVIVATRLTDRLTTGYCGYNNNTNMHVFSRFSFTFWGLSLPSQTRK